MKEIIGFVREDFIKINDVKILIEGKQLFSFSIDGKEINMRTDIRHYLRKLKKDIENETISLSSILE
jgi:hypothetical protein